MNQHGLTARSACTLNLTLLDRVCCVLIVTKRNSLRITTVTIDIRISLHLLIRLNEELFEMSSFRLRADLEVRMIARFLMHAAGLLQLELITESEDLGEAHAVLVCANMYEPHICTRRHKTRFELWLISIIKSNPSEHAPTPLLSSARIWSRRMRLAGNNRLW